MSFPPPSTAAAPVVLGCACCCWGNAAVSLLLLLRMASWRRRWCSKRSCTEECKHVDDEAAVPEAAGNAWRPPSAADPSSRLGKARREPLLEEPPLWGERSASSCQCNPILREPAEAEALLLLFSVLSVGSPFAAPVAAVARRWCCW